MFWNKMTAKHRCIFGVRMLQLELQLVDSWAGAFRLIGSSGGGRLL